MNSLNRAEIIGNITRAPELRTTKTGQNVSTLGVATNRRWKDNNGEMHDEAEYHNVVVWGRLAEIACQYLHKGSKVFFSGRMQTRSWEDDGGVKHYRTEIVAQDMIILTPKGETHHSASNDGGMAVSAPAAAPAAPVTTQDVDADDLPF